MGVGGFAFALLCNAVGLFEFGRPAMFVLITVALAINVKWPLALQLDPDRVSGTRAFVRFADEGVTLLCPGRLARIFWYNHPPIGTRISSVNGQPNPCP